MGRKGAPGGPSPSSAPNWAPTFPVPGPQGTGPHRKNPQAQDSPAGLAWGLCKRVPPPGQRAPQQHRTGVPGLWGLGLPGGKTSTLQPALA